MSDLFVPTVATLPPDGDMGRKERGAFYTPDALALAIARTLRECGIAANSILEPGCGGGAFLRAASTVWPACADIFGVDLLPACDGPGFVMQGDLFTINRRYFDLALGNPDYAIAENVVRYCLTLAAPGGHVAFLLRVAFLNSLGRVALYREHPLRWLQPIARRPSFTGGGSDPSEYGLFVWQRGFTGRGELLPPLEWR